MQYWCTYIPFHGGWTKLDITLDIHAALLKEQEASTTTLYVGNLYLKGKCKKSKTCKQNRNKNKNSFNP